MTAKAFPLSEVSPGSYRLVYYSPLQPELRGMNTANYHHRIPPECKNGNDDGKRKKGKPTLPPILDWPENSGTVSIILNSKDLSEEMTLLTKPVEVQCLTGSLSHLSTALFTKHSAVVRFEYQMMLSREVGNQIPVQKIRLTDANQPPTPCKHIAAAVETRPVWLSPFDLVTSSHMTYTGLNPQSAQASSLPITVVFLEAPPRTVGAEAEMDLLMFDRGFYVWSRMKRHNLAPVMKMTESFVQRSSDDHNSPLQQQLRLHLWDTGVYMCAMSCQFDGALGAHMAPWIHSLLHRVVTLSEKCTAESS
ncbi:uncharacterized protein V6R79_025606 [Siganus canaliculatus]